MGVRKYCRSLLLHLLHSFSHLLLQLLASLNVLTGEALTEGASVAVELGDAKNVLRAVGDDRRHLLLIQKIPYVLGTLGIVLVKAGLRLELRGR